MEKIDILFISSFKLFSLPNLVLDYFSKNCPNFGKTIDLEVTSDLELFQEFVLFYFFSS